MISDREFWENAFAAGLRREREKQGRSQEWIAEQMSARGFKFHQATVYKIESNDRRVSIGEAVTLSQVLDVPLDRMIERRPDSTEMLEHLLSAQAHDLVGAILALDDAAIEVSQGRRALEHAAAGFESHGFELTSPIGGESASATAAYRPLTSFSLADDFIGRIRSEAWTPELRELISYYAGVESLGNGDSKRPRLG